MNTDLLIAQTKKWIIDVVVGCNFCPFALREVKKESIAFEVHPGNKAAILDALSAAFARMDAQPEVETLFLLAPLHFSRFADFLKLVQAAESRLRREGYEGIYQIATFHPGYLFAGTRPSDPANYTNRAPHPMLQLLREASVSQAVDRYPDTAAIPENNIAFARQKGLSYMQALLAACLVD